MAEIGIIASVIGVAGAGFRLSLILNAVGVEIATADVEIQTIARHISLFSLMLKQVGLTLEASKSIATQTALDTTNEIANQSRTVFEEIKCMVEMVQKKDERGHIRSITVAQRVKWCFKKQRVQYLLGQLESLKLSLSIMLQTLQLGKRIIETREDPSKHPPTAQDMLQERAEIQNMVVVRHWSFVDLRRLYEMAEHEDVDHVKSPIESPPPAYNGVEHPGGDQRLAIEPAPLESDGSKAMVKYQETPLSQLDAKMNKAMTLPDKVLAQPDVNVVDHLLKEWTRVRETDGRKQRRRKRYGAHCETDDETDTSSDDSYSSRKGGRYIEGPDGTQKPRKSVKNVHFRARVESDTEDSDNGKPRNRPPSRHILRSDTSSSSSPSPPPGSRRSSDSIARFRPSAPDLTDRTRRPYTQPASANERPTSRSGPLPNAQPGMQGQPQPRSVPPQQWQNVPQSPHWPNQNNQLPQSPGLRLPPYNGQFPGPNGQYNPGHFPPPPAPQRKPSSGPYAMPPTPMQGYAPSPQPSPSSSFQPGFRGPPGPDVRSGLDARGQPRDGYQRDGYHHHSGRRHRRRGSGEREQDRERERDKKQEKVKSTRKKDVTRGLLGAGAVAGLMDLLGGLDGI